MRLTATKWTADWALAAARDLVRRLWAEAELGEVVVVVVAEAVPVTARVAAAARATAPAVWRKKCIAGR